MAAPHSRPLLDQMFASPSSPLLAHGLRRIDLRVRLSQTAPGLPGLQTTTAVRRQLPTRRLPVPQPIRGPASVQRDRQASWFPTHKARLPPPRAAPVAVQAAISSHPWPYPVLPLPLALQTHPESFRLAVLLVFPLQGLSPTRQVHPGTRTLRLQNQFLLWSLFRQSRCHHLPWPSKHTWSRPGSYQLSRQPKHSWNRPGPTRDTTSK